MHKSTPEPREARRSSSKRGPVVPEGLKYIKSNGKRLEVYHVPQPLMALEVKPGGPPLPLTDEAMSDEKARQFLKFLLDLGYYTRVV